MYKHRLNKIYIFLILAVTTILYSEYSYGLNDKVMDVYKEEMVSLICQQWEINALLENHTLTVLERKSIRHKLAKNIYQLAELIDLYQNPLINYRFKGKSYHLFSKVIKNPQFELSQTEDLVKRIFALVESSSVQVVEV